MIFVHNNRRFIKQKTYFNVTQLRKRVILVLQYLLKCAYADSKFWTVKKRTTHNNTLWSTIYGAEDMTSVLNQRPILAHSQST